MPLQPTIAQHLTTEQLRQAVLSPAPKTAVFDFDGTLWPGDAGSGFMHWTINTGLLSPERAKHLLDRHSSYHRGEVDEIGICGEMTQIYSGLTESALRESAAEYFRQHVQPHFFPTMLQLLRDLQAQGADVWAVSSTNNWMIEEGVRELGIRPDRVLAAAVEAQEGVITDRLIHVPSDEGKAEALRRFGIPHPDVVFGNSIHDLAMLQMARLPVPVNPSEELAAYSMEAGWPVYYPIPNDSPAR